MIDCWSIVDLALASSSSEAEHLAGAGRVAAARTSRTLEARRTHDGTLECCRADDTDINIPAAVSLVVVSSFRAQVPWLVGWRGRRPSDGVGAKWPRLFASPHRLVISMPEILRSLTGVLTSTWASTIDRACRKLTPPIPWPVRLCDCSRQHAIREKFQSSIFHQCPAGMLLMVCFCLDTAPPHEGQTRCFCAPKHLGRVGHLLTLPNHRGSRRPRESHHNAAILSRVPEHGGPPSRLPPATSRRHLIPAPHHHRASGEENSRADESDRNGRPPIWASTELHAKFRLCRRSAGHHL